MLYISECWLPTYIHVEKKPQNYAFKIYAFFYMHIILTLKDFLNRALEGRYMDQYFPLVQKIYC